MSTVERAPHTDSSVESSNGLMYSKPSNSDWSILLMTSLWAWAEGSAPGSAPALRPARPHRPLGAPRGLLVVGGQLHGLAGELRVEVVQPVVVGDLRLERRQGLLLLQLGGPGRRGRVTAGRPTPPPRLRTGPRAPRGGRGGGPARPARTPVGASARAPVLAAETSGAWQAGSGHYAGGPTVLPT